MEDEQGADVPAMPSPNLGHDDARVVLEFGAGPYGVGPVMGFNSDDFFRLPGPEFSDSDEPTG